MRSAGTSSSFLKSTPLETLMASTSPCWFISTSVTLAGLTSCSPRSPSVASTFIPGTISWSSFLRFSPAISPQSLALPSLLSDMLCYLFTIWKAPILAHLRDMLAHLKRHRYTGDITDYSRGLFLLHVPSTVEVTALLLLQELKLSPSVSQKPFHQQVLVVHEQPTSDQKDSLLIIITLPGVCFICFTCSRCAAVALSFTNTICAGVILIYEVYRPCNIAHFVSTK